MKPYLSETGKLLLYAGLIALGFGVFFEKSTLVFLAEIELSVLLFSFLLITPGALALDRRRVKIEVDRDRIDRFGSSYLVGDEAQTSIRIVNESGTSVYGLKAIPFGQKSLFLPDALQTISLEKGAHHVAQFPVKGLRSGRFVIHGYDISIRDFLGLIEIKDYLPNIEAFRFFPKAGRLRRSGSKYGALRGGPSGKHVLKDSGSSLNLKELRDFQPGDALKKIAWKQSMRTQKLISREFETENSTELYIGLDISSSMRGGSWDGQKLEWAIHYCVDLAEYILGNNDRVGLLSFDEKMHGHIEPGNSRLHMKRILDHLMGLYSIVDPEMTELSEDELERYVADYLLVQERLDFRKHVPEDSTSGVNRKLLEQWVHSRVSKDIKKYKAETLGVGEIAPTENILRRFLQIRGVEIPYRVEARLGMKEKGILQMLDYLILECKKALWLIIISDLCGVLNPEPLLRKLRIAQGKGHKILFVVPFTPAFYETNDDDERRKIVHELFSAAEAEERDKIVKGIRSTGVKVDYLKEGRKEIEPFLKDPFNASTD